MNMGRRRTRVHPLPSRFFMAVLALLLISAAALGLTLSGCGAAGPGPETTGPGSTGPGITSPGSTIPGGSSPTNAVGISHSMGKADLVLRMTVAGGLAAPEVSLYPIPFFSIYGDGRVIVTGPVDEIYPPAALPNLQTTVVSEAVVERILEAARSAGLFDPSFDYGQPGITDVGTTSFAVNAEGQSFQTHVYALGYEQNASDLTPGQMQARTKLRDLSGRLMDLTTFATEQLAWKPYDFSGIAVYSSGTQPTATDPSGVEVNRLDWPLGDLATLGTPAQGGLRRAVGSGQDFEALKPLLSQATSITLWKSGGGYYHLFLRPLLPDETS